MLDARSLARRARHRAARARWQAASALAGAHRHVAAGCVALTFDDGPHPDSTGRVLDALARSAVPATFFCVGRNAQAHPDVVRRAVAEGHAVGSHSQTHPYPDELPPWRLLADYDAGRRAVSEVASCEVRLFRPPHGRLPSRSAVALRSRPVVPWLWSVDPQDWRAETTREAIVAMADSVQGGDVVLLHDWVEQPQSPGAQDRSATVTALPEVVDRIRARGLRLVRLEA